MNRFGRIISPRFSFFLFTLLTCLAVGRVATAAQLTITWVDAFSNEDGFKIERKTGTTGSYAQIATVAANTTSYTDTGLLNNTTYCYHIRAYNTVGYSTYINETCATTAPDTQLLFVTLTAPTNGATVSGTTVTVSANASNNVSVVGVQFLLDGNNLGSEDTTSPYSISWNTTTVANGPHTLAARARDAAGNQATSPLVTVTVNNPGNFTLTVNKTGTSGGTVSSTPVGINCGSACTAFYTRGTVVTLTAAATAGSTFRGWNGGCTGTGTCTVTMSAARSVTATFARTLNVQIGLYRPSVATWYLDLNGNGVFNGCTVDACPAFGISTDRPIVGDWTGIGTMQLGIFDPTTHVWELDRNGNDRWEDCPIDLCRGPFGLSGDLPVAGYWRAGMTSVGIGTFRPSTGRWYLDLNGHGRRDSPGPFGTAADKPVVGNWAGNGVTRIGVFTPSTGNWKLDLNGNGTFDGCTTDSCRGPFGTTGDLPIAGDWIGTGRTQIGVFTPANGQWKLDINGNGVFDGCTVDACLGSFGQQGDLPVIGKW